MGAPALFDHLSQADLECFLLDIDTRLISFHPSTNFAWYNMFNHHFFMGQNSKNEYLSFLKDEKVEDNLVIFTDPPFGCRTEPLVDTIKKICEDYRIVNKNQKKIIPIIWVFPYYMENYITKIMPELSMSDYKVNYTNHATYNETSRARKDMGSPVRIFTNIFQR